MTKLKNDQGFSHKQGGVRIFVELVDARVSNST